MKKYDVKVTSKNSKLWTKIILDQKKRYKWNVQNSTAFMLGRYQPFHNGHERLFEKSLERVDQVLIAVKNVHGIGDNPFIYLDTKKIKSLGWKPKLKIEEAIKTTVNYLSQNEWIFKERK